MIFLVTLLCSLYGQAQEIHYNGSLVAKSFQYPGLNVELERVYFSKEKKVVSRKKVERIKRRTILGAINLGFYCQPKSHSALINTFLIKYQKVTKRSWFYSAGLGVGWYRSLLPETYKIDGNGEVKKVFLPGYTHLTPQLQLTWGRKFKKAQHIDALFIRQNTYYLLNYNYTNLPLFNVELGVGINLNTAKK